MAAWLLAERPNPAANSGVATIWAINWVQFCSFDSNIFFHIAMGSAASAGLGMAGAILALASIIGCTNWLIQLKKSAGLGPVTGFSLINSSPVLKQFTAFRLLYTKIL